MTWADFYLICFAVGFVFSVLSFVFGGMRWHLPFHFHLHGGKPLVHTGTDAPTGHAQHHGTVSPINPVTIAAFLTWFGGMGYLLTRFSGMVLIGALSLSLLAGIIAGGIVFLFLAKILISEDQHLDPADFEMVGVLGRISNPVRAGGTGEMIYSQAGTRRVCGVRAEDGSAVAKETEVVVTRYEKGIAYVRLWSELSGEDHDSDIVPASGDKGGAQ
jgi:membrane protein implicated in regulation of membrane protease activity